ncbi:MAG: HEPN domain-containing protein [Bacillota bacterium]
MRRELDWLRQAEKDLAHADISLEHRDFEWACFAAHQAAEKAAQSLLRFLGIDSWGHSVTFMLSEARKETELPDNLTELAKELDKHYIPTRYPDSHPEGAPMDYYTEKDARSAIGAAREVVSSVQDRLSAIGYPKTDARP